MSVTVAVILAVLAVGLPLAWFRFRKVGPPAKLPAGFSATARFLSDTSGTRQVAQKLGRALRALDDPHMTKCVFVKDADSARVTLEFHAVAADAGIPYLMLVRTSRGLRDGLEVEVRGAFANVVRMPRGPSQKVIHALSVALAELGTDVRWSSDGKKWRERPFYN